jgi:hypothetical protein
MSGSVCRDGPPLGFSLLLGFDMCANGPQAVTIYERQLLGLVFIPPLRKNENENPHASANLKNLNMFSFFFQDRISHVSY